MDATLRSPTQECQNALGGRWAECRQRLARKSFYVQAFDQSARDYHFAQSALALAVVLVLILVVVWYGIPSYPA